VPGGGDAEDGGGQDAGLAEATEPLVLPQSLGDFCAVYEINVYSDEPKDMPGLYSLLHQHIQDVFNEYAVQNMTPTCEADPAAHQAVPRETRYASPAKPPSGQPGMESPGPAPD